VKLQKLLSADIPAVQKFLLGILHDEYNLSPKSRPDINEMEKYYDGEKNILWVWKEDGKIVGTVGIGEINTNFCFLRRFFLAPEKRGAGNGRKLFEFFVQEAKNRGYTKAYWATIFPFIEAQKFYAHCGAKNIPAFPAEIEKHTTQKDDLFYEYDL
jgi:GNAT superfamily N-acetyltransferase